MSAPKTISELMNKAFYQLGENYDEPSIIYGWNAAQEEMAELEAAHAGQRERSDKLAEAVVKYTLDSTGSDLLLWEMLDALAAYRAKEKQKP